MPPSEPGWWYQPCITRTARALAPCARLWGHVAERRWRRSVAFRASLPVICVGNFTAGGTGKTPLAAEIAGMVSAAGKKPIILSRGYGGRQRGPHLVDPARDRALAVGDEALLLARRAPVMVSRDRAEGARAIAALGDADHVVIMDDGLQNPSLMKDLVIAVVDGRRGLGNGLVMPAGPLRAPLAFQLPLVDAIVVNTPESGAPRDSAMADAMRAPFNRPVLLATTVPAAGVEWIGEQPIMAWAGIGAPRRLFDLLQAYGATLVGCEAFADHHVLRPAEARRLLAAASQKRAQLVTTEKDWVRLNGSSGDLAALQAASRFVPIRLSFEPADRQRLEALVAAALSRSGVRQLNEHTSSPDQ